MLRNQAREINGAGPYALVPRPVYGAFKRMVDLLVAVIVLTLGSPIWLAVALAIRLTSPGPAIFHRVAVGRHGKRFRIYKFRTMRHEASDAVHLGWLRDYIIADQPFRVAGGRPVYKVLDDPRITTLGGWLRRTSLDEVPQFLNVLRGEMSIVGPRPPIPEEFNLYDDMARSRLSVRPGITGLYQVMARGRVPFSEVIKIDLDYIRRRSTALDFRIMSLTPWVMLTGRGSGQEATPSNRPA
jgi:lipopolysaccharide/colanic/teichoic acid biosynthesis glycosyltransferase